MTPEQRANTAQVMQRAIWQTADKFLRGVVEEEDYGDYIIPFAVLRRLECLLAPTKAQVLDFVASASHTGFQLDFQIKSKFGLSFYNSSTLDLATITATDDNVAAGLEEYVAHFSDSVSDLWEKFKFAERVKTLDEAGRLWGVCRHFANLDMHPDSLSDTAMGDIFEDVMYRAFNTKGKGAGAFYTPRDAIELMVEVLFSRDDDSFQGRGQSRSVYDPTAGTGGMLLVAKRALKDMNPNIDVNIFGQESMDAAFAIGKADLLIQGGRPGALRQGNTLREDRYADRQFDFVLSNPPFGTDWSADYKFVTEEAKAPGSRFAHGLPRRNDGQMLFMSHVVSKLMPPNEDGIGGRGAIVSNGSPLFAGAPGSGEDKIRSWLLNSDLVDTIIALPTEMFYGTKIATYVWIFDTAKEERRKGKVQLIDGSDLWKPMGKPMGDKRHYIHRDARKTILDTYDAFEDSDISKIVTVDELGFRDVPVSRPRRLSIAVTDEAGEAVMARKDAPDGLRQVLAELDGAWNDLPETLRALGKKHDVKITAGLIDAVMEAVAVDDDSAPPAVDRRGNALVDKDSQLIERIQLAEDVGKHMEANVLPFAPDVTWDTSKAKVGYEIPFTRLFYQPEPTRSLEEIDAEVRKLMDTLTLKFEAVEEA